ncbi:hypothetical protein PAMC26510_31110 [Caballeronia sordidicola]|uniref:Uncharacterized protein n=1 Tax=Caballeronia sordidicola TaxID=196367 RepID=A0A242M7Z3_CABSO|nr:hypothetical protein PAMC26510_31110 [Caballeronia sordidicola]
MFVRPIFKPLVNVTLSGSEIRQIGVQDDVSRLENVWFLNEVRLPDEIDY